MNEPERKNDELTRRDVLRGALRGGTVFGMGGLAGYLAGGGKAQAGDTVWQLDPNKCVKCGNCATYCVLETSAVKCVHDYKTCGYCELCFGYFEPKPNEVNTAAENQLCPTGAIKRTWVEDPYFEYTIDESLCVGCGKCVKVCGKEGNAALFLQVRHDRCLNCSQCTIALACPADAFRRVPADQPYILKNAEREA